MEDYRVFVVEWFYDFRNPYCGHEQCIYFEFPKNLQEAEAFIREMRTLK